MSTENTAVETEVQTPLQIIKRGDFELPLFPTKRLKGRKKGHEYPSFVAKTVEDQDKLLNFLGRDIWFDKVQSWWKTFCLNVVKEFTSTDTGEVDWDQAYKALSELSCRGETLGELLNHCFEVQAKFQKAFDDGDFANAKKYGQEYRTLKATYDGKRRAKAEKKDDDEGEENEPAEAPALM
jgi:hypothetical protein